MINFTKKDTNPASYEVVTWNGKVLGQLEMDVDGYYYFWPQKDIQGFWQSVILRSIADELDKINKDWNERVFRDIGSCIEESKERGAPFDEKL